MEEFRKAIAGSPESKLIDKDIAEGQQLGVTATPTLVVDGHKLVGRQSYAQLKQVIDAEIHDEPWPTKARINVDASTAASQGPAFASVSMTEFTAQTAVGIPSENLSLGPRDAQVRIEWYVDLTSPLTAESAVALEKFMAAHQGRAAVEFRNFPLPTHPDAMVVHEFALAAAVQGKFWEVESLLLADPEPKTRAELKAIASQAQLDQKKLWEEVDGHKYAPIISRDLSEAKRRGIAGTPTFVVGNRKLDGADGLAALY